MPWSIGEILTLAGEGFAVIGTLLGGAVYIGSHKKTHTVLEANVAWLFKEHNDRTINCPRVKDVAELLRHNNEKLDTIKSSVDKLTGWVEAQAQQPGRHPG